MNTDDRNDRRDRLIDAIGDIKDEYIEDAHGIAAGDVRASGSRKKFWYSLGSLAAALILFFGIGTTNGWFAGFNPFNDASDIRESIEEEAEVTTEEGDAEVAEYEYSAEAAIAGEGSAGAMDSEAKAETATEVMPNNAEEPAEESMEEIAIEEEIDGDVIEIDPGDEPLIEEPQTVGEAFVLTAGRWKDNDNWPFFVNLVNAGTISFPSYGVDPRNRIKVKVLDADGDPVRGEEVLLEDEDGDTIWRARSDKDGVAYLFIEEGYEPAALYVAGERQELYVEEVVDDAGDQQGTPVAVPTDDITVTITEPTAEYQEGLQVMFIVDTTGSMGDEIAYLQKDFSSIAESVGSDGVSYSVNFYRDDGDEYVVKTNPFTDDVGEVVELLSAEYAAGGGDEPEAVADALYETITANDEWRSDKKKIAFLIFDAPPHYGMEGVVNAAVREAAARGIILVPVVASNANRETELFGRALAICTNGTYVFLTDDSGVGESHLEPIIGDYDVELLHDIIVDLIREQM